MWKGFPLSGASSERGSVKADGGRGSGQENMESSLSLKSIVWSEDTDTRVRVRGRSQRDAGLHKALSVTMETGLNTTAKP